MLARQIVLGLSALVFFSCTDQNLVDENAALKDQVTTLKQNLTLIKQVGERTTFLRKQLEGVKARIVTNYGNIELDFFNQDAPLHCFNFITRAESGFYDNTLFHRIIPGFMIQGGDPNTKTKNSSSYGQGGPLVNIPHEFNKNKHEAGVLSMARQGNKALGAGSQFFITHKQTSQLDNEYTVFGKVTKGMEVVDKIANVKRNARDLPDKPVQIKTIEVYR